MYGTAWRQPALSLSILLVAGLSSPGAGVVVGWGDNALSQSTPPPGLTDVVAVAGGHGHSLALKLNGTVVSWGDNAGQATVPPDLTNAVAIAANGSYSLALKGDGSIAAWGGQMPPPNGLGSVIGIAAGLDYSLALKADGTVVAWGSQTSVPTGLSNVVALAAGGGQNLALRGDGTVVAWGDDEFGQAQVPADLRGVVAVAAGAKHSLALKADGTVVAWGWNCCGQAWVPEGLSSVVAIAAGSVHSLALKADGTVVAWGSDTYHLSTVDPTLDRVFAIGAGDYHCLAVKGDGSVTILANPASQRVILTNDVFFSVLAAGAPPLSFQWQQDGTNLLGATTAVLTITNVQWTDAGIYSAVVSNRFGAVASAGAVLTPVGTPPAITLQPRDQSTICGEAASFRVSAGGLTPYSFQWQFRDQPILNATNTSLRLNNVTPDQAGPYAAVVSNPYGSVTSAPALLTVTVEPPSITSPLTATAAQGQPFQYTITALHSPNAFTAAGLPAGLTLSNAVISGTPLDSGTFGPAISAINACASDTETLLLTISSSLPVITSPASVIGAEGVPLTYQVTATKAPTGFGADNLPPGLSVDDVSGRILGQPVMAGEFDSVMWASNAFGTGTGPLHFSISNATLSGLAIANVTYDYSSPYLLDFHFSLLDTTNDPSMGGNPVVVDPRLLSATCFEDTDAVSANETGALLALGSRKLLKAYLVLDFTESIASLVNGDANGDGISDAVDLMVKGAQTFVNQQPADAQVGVYEFHREDMDPVKVLGLTSDKKLLNNSIAGIWTNYVQGFPASSRCWDALGAAIKAMGATNRDELHYVIFVSDGHDESSTNSITNVISAAISASVKVYGVGFGAELDTNTLQQITTQTQGRLYTATSVADLAAELALVSKDVNGQYLLRWATLKRTKTPFLPSFQISYQGLTAISPPNPTYLDTNNPVIDTNNVPPTTNYNTLTNFIIGNYVPTGHTGNVTVGALRLVSNAEVKPTGVTLRASYAPRFIRQLRVHYRPNWPCTTRLESSGPGQILAGWSLTETNDGAGGKWALLSSAYPPSITNSIPYAALGNLLTFVFRDELVTNAFSVFEVDNTLYTNTGRQTFAFDLTNRAAFVTNFPVLPYGTPVPWLMAHGFPSNWAAAETNDFDLDGMLTWQEYRANTDPRDRTSRFVLRDLYQAPDRRFHITFSTALNRNYQVESSSDLVNWEVVEDNLAGTGADLTVTDTRYLPDLKEIFYRVLVY